MRRIEHVKVILSYMDLFFDKIMKNKLVPIQLLNTFKQSFVGMIQQKGIETHLGRWNIDYCSKKINNKVDLSNEDHCGPCGQYALHKNNVKLEKTKI